jgi:hypothetical protein
MSEFPSPTRWSDSALTERAGRRGARSRRQASELSGAERLAEENAARAEQYQAAERLIRDRCYGMLAPLSILIRLGAQAGIPADIVVEVAAEICVVRHGRLTLPGVPRRVEMLLLPDPD